VFAVALVLQHALLAGGAACEPAPEVRTPPRTPQMAFAAPTLRATVGNDGETLKLENDAIRVVVVIDPARRGRMTSLATQSGRELLAAPTVPMSIAEDEEVVVDGGEFAVESWIPRHHGVYTELEIRLSAPEPVIWRLRLYRDRPYLEQRFEAPRTWRRPGRALTQVLTTDASLRPVMPSNIFREGFAGGRPKLAGRHRFEFVAQSDHLCYDPDARAGMAGFVAGIGGEERFVNGAASLLDHVTREFGDEEPVARFLLWPFEGPIELGFLNLRRFIREDYACQGKKHSWFSWNQFWRWQGPDPDCKHVNAERLLDILPHVAAIGCEEFHLDDGWQEGKIGDGWRFDSARFPEGFEPLRRFIRRHGMRYHTWINEHATAANPDIVTRLIEETDMCKLFMDLPVDERSIGCLRKVRARYPDFESFAHNSTSRSDYYFWGNIHFLSDFNTIYFGEFAYWDWSAVLPENPEGDAKERFFSKHSLRAGDLLTRAGAYQAHWAWPYATVMPPHYGWAWFEGRELSELASRMFSTIAARNDYQWGFDPRELRAVVLEFFLDWTAFYKVNRRYLQVYQHVLPVPDGIHPDGAAHVIDGRGYIVLCNPGEQPARVAWRDLLWEPELELDPRHPMDLSDWSKPLAPQELAAVDLARPEGELELGALEYRVIGLNVDIRATQEAIKRERSQLHDLSSGGRGP